MRSGHHQTNPTYRLGRGFTLVELALVVAIIGLITGAGLATLSSQLLQTRIETTRDRQMALKVALKAFIAREGRLPCPAVGTLPITDPNFGLEADRATGSHGSNACTGTVNVGGVCNDDELCSQVRSFRGVPPWRTLGLPQDSVLDAWGRFFTYQVSLTAVVNPFEGGGGAVVDLQIAQAMLGNVRVHSAVPVSTANLINGPSPAVTALLSHGANGSGAFYPGGTSPLPAPSGATEIENTDNTPSLVSAEYSDSTANPFDDIVRFYSVPEMLDGIAFSNPGLENSAGRFRFLIDMIAYNIGSSSPAVVGPPTQYPVPADLDDADVPVAFQRYTFQEDSKAEQIDFVQLRSTITIAIPSNTTPVVRLECCTPTKTLRTVTAGELRLAAARLGVPLRDM